MRAWVTKYALTAGILEVDAERCTDRMISVDAPGNYTSCYHGDDWHDTREAAVARAEEMRKKKIASLKKQLAKLEALKF